MSSIKGKKVMTAVLAIVMMVCMLPINTAVFAQGTQAQQRTTTLRLDNYGQTIWGGTWSSVVDEVSTYVSSSSIDEGWKWQYDTVNQKYTLTLSNVNIEVANGTAIQLPNATKDIEIDIVLVGENVVSGGGNATYDSALCGIYAPSTTYSSAVTIKGGGTLDVSSNPDKPFNHNYGKAIYIVNGSLMIEDTTVAATGTILAFTDIHIKNSDVIAKSFNDESAIYCYGNLTIEDSDVDSSVENQRTGASDDNSRALHGTKAVTIKNSTIKATGGAYGITAGSGFVLTIDNSDIIAEGHTGNAINGDSVFIKDSVFELFGKRYAIYAGNGVIDIQNSTGDAQSVTYGAIYTSRSNNTDPAILLEDGLAIQEAGKIAVSAKNAFGNTSTAFIPISDDILITGVNSNALKKVTIYKTADYSAVNAAISGIPADLSLYTDATAQTLIAAKNAVVPGKDISEQVMVDGYARAIENAIVALVYKDADYSAVDAAIANIPADLSIYTDETVAALNAAKNAVVHSKNSSEQETVDGYATAIEDAIVALAEKSTGALTASPSLDNKTANSLTIKANTAPGNGQTIEYALSTTGSVPASGWQDGLIFNNLSEYTQYYIFARSAENGNYKAGVASEVLSVYTKDVTMPEVEISLDTNNWNSFWHTATFGLFFKETQKITITATDNGSGVDKVYYYKSATVLSEEEVKALASASWTEISSGGHFNVIPDDKLVVYVKTIDKEGNIAYVSSDGIVIDATLPIISGIMDGATYCEAQTVTVTDDYLDTVKVNGTDVTLTSGTFTLSPATGTQTVVAIDKAGNSTTVTVTVHNGHSYGDWIVSKMPTTEAEGERKKVCFNCGDVVTEKLKKLTTNVVGKDGGDPAFDAKAKGLSDAVDIIKELEKGNKVDIYLKVIDISDTILKEDKAAIAAKLQDNETIGIFLDISLFTVITDPEGNSNEIQHSDANKLITIMITIPEEYWNMAPYTILQMHEGEVTRIETQYDAVNHTLTFQADKFSTYAIVASEEETAVDPTPTPNEPSKDNPTKTGDNSNPTFWLLFGGMSLITLGGLSMYSSRRKKTIK